MLLQFEPFCGNLLKFIWELYRFRTMYRSISNRGVKYLKRLSISKELYTVKKTSLLLKHSTASVLPKECRDVTMR